MNKTGMNMSRTLARLGMLAVAGMTLMMSGCAIHSVDKEGNDCVVGQTCPGMLTRPITNKVLEGMNVIGVHKPGSDVWNNAIRTDALKFKMTQDAVRGVAQNKDFVQVRKMGFMFAVNTHGGLYASGLNVGDVIDVGFGDGASADSTKLVRIVKRAGE